MADAFAAGALQPTSDLVAQVPWPDAGKHVHARRLRPVGNQPFGVGARLRARVSRCCSRRSIAGRRVSMRCSSLTPIAGALLVWLTFVAGRRLAGPIAGAMAAVLVAVEPGDALSGGSADERRDDGRVVDGDVRRRCFARRWTLAGCLLRARVARSAEPAAARAASRAFVSSSESG